MKSYNICLFSVWLISLSTMPSISIHVVANSKTLLFFFFFIFYFWLYSSYDWVIFSSVQPLICVRLFATPWTAVCQASLSITNSRSLSKLMSIESVMPSNQLILCNPLLFLPSIFLSFRVFSNELAPRIRWPKYQSFSFNISPSNEHPELIFSTRDWLDLHAVQGQSLGWEDPLEKGKATHPSIVA